MAWGEMDAFQHVNNVAYFRYFETARVRYFADIDFLQLMDESGIGPILKSASCRYRAPVRFPDHLTVGARVSAMGDDRFTMEYAIYSTALDRIAATGEAEIVSIDYRSGTRVPLPHLVRARIEKLEGKRFET